MVIAAAAGGNFLARHQLLVPERDRPHVAFAHRTVPNLEHVIGETFKAKGELVQRVAGVVDHNYGPVGSCFGKVRDGLLASIGMKRARVRPIQAKHVGMALVVGPFQARDHSQAIDSGQGRRGQRVVVVGDGDKVQPVAPAVPGQFIRGQNPVGSNGMRVQITQEPSARFFLPADGVMNRNAIGFDPVGAGYDRPSSGLDRLGTVSRRRRQPADLDLAAHGARTSRLLAVRIDQGQVDPINGGADLPVAIRVFLTVRIIIGDRKPGHPFRQVEGDRDVAPLLVLFDSDCYVPFFSHVDLPWVASDWENAEKKTIRG